MEINIECFDGSHVVYTSSSLVCEMCSWPVQILRGQLAHTEYDIRAETRA